ncbi:hypothetical protein RB195_010349 [Necator americanus]|uniref:Reverse transcriptase domain-containing protein n=1 Tax=Necator americanus TaxID=51031 RepID=A0ABR1CXJ1_NECAM
MQLAFLDFEAAFDSPYRGCLLNALRADGVAEKFARLLDDMNQRTTAAVRTPAGCTTPFEVVIGSMDYVYALMQADVDLFETSNGNEGGWATDRTRRWVLLPGPYAEEQRQPRQRYSAKMR